MSNRRNRNSRNRLNPNVTNMINRQVNGRQSTRRHSNNPRIDRRLVSGRNPRSVPPSIQNITMHGLAQRGLQFNVLTSDEVIQKFNTQEHINYMWDKIMHELSLGTLDQKYQNILHTLHKEIPVSERMNSTMLDIDNLTEIFITTACMKLNPMITPSSQP